MIEQLRIKNFALIDDITIEFVSSLNVFTGETGAGKSILIDALRFVLGERINSSQVRDPEASCVVEGVFLLPDAFYRENPEIKEYVDDEDGTLIINRGYMPDGRNKIKVNGSTITVGQLKTIGDRLIDFHGPNDHQMLLARDSHIRILDRLSSIGKYRDSYNKYYKEYRHLQSERDELKKLADNRDRELEVLSHQIKELEQVTLSEEKYDELKAEEARINNTEKLYEYVNKLIDILENSENGINEKVSEAFGPLRKLTSTDESTKGLLPILENIQINCSELNTYLSDYASGLSFDPARVEEINSLSDIYFEILRKYGPDLSDAEKFYQDILKKYELLVDLEHNDSNIEKNISKVRKKLTDVALNMSKERAEAGSMLQETIKKELKELGISHVEFECRIERGELGRDGFDTVTFYISPNAGEPLKPLSEIVSSGEAARLMLAMKKALTKVDPIPVLIFDEIDSQIGGRLGTITGKKLKELSEGRQVILITHLPQIASFGARHFKVKKQVVNNHTFTHVETLKEDLRVAELAKMMSGEKESDISVKHAKDMLLKAAGK